MKENQRFQGIQVISRAADILRVLGENTQGLSLGQISKQVELPRSTVQRIVGALSLEGLVSADGRQGGIKLGPAIQSLAHASSFDPREQFRPTLQDIAVATTETVDLAVLDGRKMRFIDQIVGSQRLRTVSSIGDTFPLTTTANGKAALALLGDAAAKQLIETELADNPDIAIHVPTLLTELAAIRNGAFARDEDEHTDGISAMGFAVQGEQGSIVAISVPVPSSRFQRSRERLSASLAAARQKLIDQRQL